MTVFTRVCQVSCCAGYTEVLYNYRFNGDVSSSTVVDKGYATVVKRYEFTFTRLSVISQPSHLSCTYFRSFCKAV